MFEYIKRVSIAISFVAQKIDDSGSKSKSVLETLSFDLLLMAQSFRTEEYKVSDLKKLESKISYLIDVVDFARINNFISTMNAKVFVDSQLAFLKHIINLIDQKNSLSLPIYHLKQLDESFARKSAKENSQSKFTDKFENTTLVSHALNDFNFSNTNGPDRVENLSYQNINTSSPKTNKTVTESVANLETAEAPKKILEESMINPTGSPESVEKEIEGRRGRILKTLVTGGGSIKEISAKMRDVNEKTIQRDLLELMREKKVIMLGKKRWAKYYLK